MSDEFAEILRDMYCEHRQELFTYALSLTNDPSGAEDAVHAAFDKLLRGRRTPRNLRPYVFRCVRNAAIDQRRAVQREELRESIFDVAQVAPEDTSLRLQVEEALNRLSSNEKDAVVLKVYSGLTFREIARIRRVPLQTAASWYRRGMERLKREWTSERNES